MYDNQNRAQPDAAVNLNLLNVIKENTPGVESCMAAVTILVFRLLNSSNRKLLFFSLLNRSGRHFLKGHRAPLRVACEHLCGKKSTQALCHLRVRYRLDDTDNKADLHVAL